MSLHLPKVNPSYHSFTACFCSDKPYSSNASNTSFSVKPKQSDRLIKAIDLRLQGYKYSEIATMLEIKETSVKKDFQTLKELWKEFNK